MAMEHVGSYIVLITAVPILDLHLRYNTDIATSANTNIGPISDINIARGAALVLL